MPSTRFCPRCLTPPKTRNMPRVTVVTPNYNHAQYLPRCIDSVLAQAFQDIELIILDDAFTDSSREIIQRPDTGLKAPPALGGSAMVARPTRRQIFAVNGTAPAYHDRRAEPGHSTSEMIQEDMKIL